MIVRRHAPFTALFIILSILAVAPLLAVLGYTFFKDGTLSFDSLLSVLQNNSIVKTMQNSLLLGLYVIALTTCIALPLAIIRTKTFLAKYDWLDIVFTIPFMTPPYIGSMGWILFMQHNGYYEQIFQSEAPFTFFSVAGMVFIMSMHLYPFLYLMLKNALLRIDGSFQDATLIYGGNPIMNWIRAILPLLISSYVMAALLVFIKTLAEFGTPATFGKRIGYDVFTTEIHGYLSHWPINISAATSLSLILLSVCMLIWYIQNVISRKHSYGTLSGKSTIANQVKDSLIIRIVSSGYVLIILGLSIGIPYFSIIATSLLKVRGEALSMSNVTFSHYTDLFTVGSSSFQALMNSINFAFVASTIAACIGFCAALYIKDGKRKPQQFLDFTSLLSNIIPGIVFVVGLILFWNAAWLPTTIYNTNWMPILTYIVLFLPYSVQYTKSALSQLHPSIHQSNAVFAQNNWMILLKVWLPLLGQGILAGWMMTFIISMRELVGSLLILPPSVETSATFIFSQFEQGDVSKGMAMAVITVLITILCIFLIELLQRKALRTS
ncbi:iron ABC transporter permease [Ornithinibacillus sp. BX22]|uniref:Iron ABC transporter permease n=2 Tax=Ornithinibacillus TaxID=484508 RepID=A0A923L8D8_9BACI|nr:MULTISPECIES: iron ABC transporter permease [Ornithinibacillus]MBC5638274.1 iron ABC transporter permease [Ornithinibacillus hominis]MBS3680946.1 iron ABC transporter permease [Ornithinibacillus massiliensis]